MASADTNRMAFWNPALPVKDRVDDLVRVLGKRPFNKSVEYDEFINASWKRVPTPPAEAGAVGEPAEPAEPAVACK